MSLQLITPVWPAPPSVKATVTTRQGGVSVGPWAGLNLGSHVGDHPDHVAANRALLAAHLPSAPLWLDQVHGTHCVSTKSATLEVSTQEASNQILSSLPVPTADASVSTVAGAVSVVLTADCLPVLFCNQAGTVVAAAHAGWRGLLAGVLEATLAQMNCANSEVIAWLGPAIGPKAFEVGDEVRAAFVAHHPAAASAFVQSANAGKWLADIYALARQRLARAGVSGCYGGDLCTVSDPDRFYSYRREGVTGRMASLIWLSPQ